MVRIIRAHLTILAAFLVISCRMQGSMTANKDAFAMAEPSREAAGMSSITSRDGSWYFREKLAHATVGAP